MTTRAIVLLLSVAGWGCASTGAPVSAVRYPSSRVEPVVASLHGESVPDPFRWLEDERSPEVKAWMSAQDGLARERLRQLPGREALVRRFRELLYADSTGRAGQARWPAVLPAPARRPGEVPDVRLEGRTWIPEQTANPGGSPAYLRIETNAGHTGADQVRKTVEARADSLAFLFEALRITAGSAAKPASGRGTTGG